MARSACSCPDPSVVTSSRLFPRRQRIAAALRALCCALLLFGLPLTAASQSQARHISVTWTEAPIHDVLRAFAVFSGMSIVPGVGVDGFVTADINDQPWDVALRTILSTRGFVATEDEHGIIRVESMENLSSREGFEQLITRSYRISYGRASELQATVGPLLTERGTVSVVESTNTLVISDVARVHLVLVGLLR